jgi:hypothetical protein
MSHPGDSYCNCEQACAFREALVAARAALVAGDVLSALRAIQTAADYDRDTRLAFDEMNWGEPTEDLWRKDTRVQP